MKNFALIGVAGFIAPRHLQAIKDTGNNLVAALDKFDSVGIMDSYFPNADFFTEFERFDRHLEKLRRQGVELDYVSICSPNYLHDSHIRFALRHGADAICEKPLVLNPWNLDALMEIEKETSQKVYTILQLRLHPAIQALKREIEGVPKDKKFKVNLTYITSRGHWYHHSWKGEENKSGGIATNIGVHFFDMLIWIFGKSSGNVAEVIEEDHAAGVLHLERAEVHWSLSINANHLPADVTAKGKRTYRSLQIEGREIEFSDGFTDLHTKCYEQILAGNGFGITDAVPSIETVYHLRRNK
ncbi:MAG: Gfo/Idh/MocA family oxidoreductase [Bacteroidota bacterium]